MTHLVLISCVCVFKSSADVPGLAVDMIMIPSLAIYAAGAVKWVIANARTPVRSRRKNADAVGLPYVMMLTMITGVFLGALTLGVAGLFLELPLITASVDTANSYFGVVEGGFGALFGYFYDDLFGARTEARKAMPESEVAKSSAA